MPELVTPELATPELVTYDLAEAVATITLDDGKVNVMTLADARRDQRRARPGRTPTVPSSCSAAATGVFSARLRSPGAGAGGSEALAMVRAGFELAERVLSFPTPVVMECTGHAIAMGVFLLLVGRLPGRRGRAVQAHRERGGDRADDAAGRGRGPAASGSLPPRSTGRRSWPSPSPPRPPSRPASSTAWSTGAELHDVAAAPPPRLADRTRHGRARGDEAARPVPDALRGVRDGIAADYAALRSPIFAS